MKDIWSGVHDPVYDLVVFNEPSPRARLEGPGGSKSKIRTTRPGKRMYDVVSEAGEPECRPFLFSREFRRLLFLRQLSLGWLVFPSATHTRYAHSIGVYALGLMSLSQSRIKTRDAKKPSEPLYKWAQKRNLDDELLTALLLHDIGDIPFSKALEPLFPNITPQKLTSALILFNDDELKNTPFRKIYSQYLEKHNLPNIDQGFKTHQGRLLSSVLKDYFKTLSRAVVCLLIGGYDKPSVGQDQQSFTGISEDFLRKRIDQDKQKGLWSGTNEDLKVMEMLVSGLLDLEKFDHYHRHGFYTGIKIANFNFKDFIRGATIEVPEPDADPFVDLTRIAAAQTIAMLQGRETIRRYIFLRPEAIALRAMFRWAAAKHINNNCYKEPGDEEDCFLWLFKTDDEVACELRSSKTQSVRLMMDMLINGYYYKSYKRGRIKAVGDIKDVQGLNEWLENLAKNAGLFGNDETLPKVIWELPAAVSYKDKDPGDKWLNIKQFRVRGGSFTNSDKNLFEFLKKGRKQERIRFKFLVHPRHPNAIEKGDFLKEVETQIDFD